MKIAALLIFAISTAIHLYASAKKDQKLRNLTKPWILLALLAFYLFASEKDALTVILALVFSWLGDVLLMGKGVKWFTAGGIAFMAGHVCFVLSYLPEVNFAALPLWEILLPAAVFLTATVLVFSKLRAHLPKALFYPMFLYLLINGTMNCFALYRCFSDPCTATLTSLIGAVLFFISDASLFFVRFKKDGKERSHFWVMLTYSVGELLIVLGLL